VVTADPESRAQGGSPSRTCIYCREFKTASDFNREHVVPDAFGRYEGAFVLTTVCSTCNAYFGDRLDIRLARESIEGLDRYEHGVKNPTGKTQFGRSGLLRARVNDGGFADGAEVWWGPSPEGDRLVLHFDPQVGFEDDAGKRTWCRTTSIPTKQELQALGFAFPLDIKFVGIAEAEALQIQRLLVEKGFGPSPLQRVEGPTPAEIDIDIKGAIDRTLMRAVAKIAFNYLAYQYPAIAQMSQFDAVRRYIRHDPSGSTAPVTVIGGNMLAGVEAPRAFLVHCAAVEWQPPQVVGHVQLFSRFRYRIVLADGGFLIPPTTVNKGHVFDPMNHQIVELTSDPHRGRPISELSTVEAPRRR
jgi:hypothetical protein